VISFLTLFLGLVAGPHPIEVSVAGDVASVEFVLDGSSVASIPHPPWRAVVDFGRDLTPHEVIARALDAAGHPLGLARQWVNLPRQPAEVGVLLEKDEKGVSRSAKLTVESLYGPPESVTVTFDGRPLVAKESLRFELPAYDAATTHLLSAVAQFRGSIRSRRDVVVGGGASGEARSELTAVPVRFGPDSTPTLEGVSGLFVKNGQALAPVAVERGSAQLLIVRDLSCDEAIARLGRGGKTLFDAAQIGTSPVYNPEAMRQEMRLGDEDHVRFVWPKAAAVSSARTPTELFETSHEFLGTDGGLHWLLTRVYHPARVEPHPRFADAVAIAGLQAFQSYGRRAVVLVLGKRKDDASLYSPATVRSYLKSINVPLFVWSLADLSRGSSSAWQDVEDISTVDKLKSAFSHLQQNLDSQWIVWLEGEHRPNDIALAAGARGLELVR
jgi:hypothetical protein